MVLERGTLLNNRYKIEEILGQGGMGSVYRATDQNLNVQVAVKDNFFTSDEYASQFKREAVILAGLRHPNLPRVTDHFVIQSQGQYLVMDYIEGEDLRQRMDRMMTLPDEEVITIGAAVCEALTYLEARKPAVVHRDIKPGNIKITPTGNIYLVDFGLVKTIHDSQITATGARAMTPGYSPPEQYGTARTDSRSDIYSLGATLYAALTGIVPEDSLARAMDQEKLTPIRKHNPRVSRKLANAIEKSMEVKPENRYQSAEDFKNALLSSRTLPRRKDDLTIEPPPYWEIEPSREPDEAPDFSQAMPSTPLPTSTVLEGKKLEKDKLTSRRRIVGASCLVIFLGLLITVILVGRSLLFNSSWVTRFPGMLSQLYQTTPGTPVAWFIEGLGQIELKLSTGTLVNSPSETPSFTPTQRVLPTLTLTPSTTPTLQPTITHTLTITLTPLPTPLGGGGGQIAFASKRSGSVQIYLTNVDDTAITQLTDLPDGACQPSWSPDGKQLVFISPCERNIESYPGAAMFTINADGSNLMPLPSVPGGDFDPAWSPDGKKIAFTSIRNSGQYEIYVLNLTDLTVKGLSPKYGRDHQPFWSADGSQILFVSDREGKSQIWVMNADGTDQQKFSFSGTRTDLHPNWSPDGSLVLFTQSITPGGIPNLAVAPYNETRYEEYRLINDISPMRDARYSPDGYWVTYEGWPTGSNHDIFIMANNGSGRRAIASDPAIDFDPAWRPLP